MPKKKRTGSKGTPWFRRKKQGGPAVIAEPASAGQQMPILQFHPDFQKAGVPANAVQVWRTKGGYILDCIQVVPQGDGQPALYMVSRVTLPTLAFLELMEQGERLREEERAMVEEQEAEAALAASMLACPECPEGNPPRIDCELCDGTGLVTEDQQDEWAQAQMRAMDTTALGDDYEGILAAEARRDEAELEGDGSGESLSPIVEEMRDAARPVVSAETLGKLAEADSRSPAQREADMVNAAAQTGEDAYETARIGVKESHREASFAAGVDAVGVEAIARGVDAKLMKMENPSGVPRSPLLTNRDTGDEAEQADAEPKLSETPADNVLQCLCGQYVAAGWASCPKCGRDVADAGPMQDGENAEVLRGDADSPAVRRCGCGALLAGDTPLCPTCAADYEKQELATMGAEPENLEESEAAFRERQEPQA